MSITKWFKNNPNSLDIESSVDSIYEHMELINRNKNITHFEFLTNPSNYKKIEDYFLSNDVVIVPLEYIKKEAPDELNFIAGALFHDDYTKIFRDKCKEHLLRRPIYNTILVDTDIFTDYKEMETYTLNRYNYRIPGGGTFEFNLEHHYGSSTFDINILLKHAYITCGYEDMSELEKKAYDKYFCMLGMDSQKISINKVNIENFIENFLNTINACNITDISVLKYFKQYQAENLLNYFFAEDLTKEKIEQWNINLKNHKPSHNRAYFDYEQTYTMCLSEDIAEYFKDCDIVHHNLYNIYININYCSDKELYYQLKISENAVELYNQDELKAQWYGSKNNPLIFQEITGILERDFKASLQKNTDFNTTLTSKIKSRIFEHHTGIDIDDISVEIPDLSTLSISQVINRHIPIILKKDEDQLEIIIDDDDGSEWYKNKEIEAFMEKIKIKNILSNNNDVLSSKKRL